VLIVTLEADKVNKKSFLKKQRKQKIRQYFIEK